MNYFVREFVLSEKNQMTAHVKARDDIDAVFSKMGMCPIEIPPICGDMSKGSYLHKFRNFKRIAAYWEEKLPEFKQGDTLFIQFPNLEISMFLQNVFSRLQKKGVRICLLIHDLNFLRNGIRNDVSPIHRSVIRFSEVPVLKLSDKVIVHNKVMGGFLADLGVEADRIVELEMFDYLVDSAQEKRYTAMHREKDLPVIIAGSLRPHKSGYVYQLPDAPSFHLYGIGYEGQEQSETVIYKGAFPPEVLPFILEGSFGLVWDGDTADAVSGVYGEYMKFNNPHKLSLYLASGIPVIVWDQAATKAFVEKNHCGICVGSLNELQHVISEMTRETYAELLEGAQHCGNKIRAGHYTQSAVRKCLL